MKQATKAGAREKNVKSGKGAPRRAAKPIPALVQVTTQGGPFSGASGPTLKRRALKMLSHLELGGVELSVALVGDDAIHALNKTYRGKDKPTDVLAFPLQERRDWEQWWKVRGKKLGRSGRARAGDAVPKASPMGLLGDVILSVDTARRQARDNRRPLLAELTMLLAHGLLHLVGYDHHTDAEELAMTAETQALEAVAGARAAG